MSGYDVQEVQDDENGFPNEAPQEEEQEEVTEPSEENTEGVSENGEQEVTQEEVQEQTKPKQKNRVPAKTRINQLFREKSQAQHEAQLLRAEVERLRKLSEVSNAAAMSHYDNSIQLRLDRAKQLKAEAIQNNDVQAQVDADLEMSRVAAQLEALEAWKAQNSHSKNTNAVAQQSYTQQQPTQNVNYQQQVNPELNDWLQNNTWFVPDHPDYNDDMHNEVRAYADTLDRKYARMGQHDKIGSAEYFNAIDEYVAREFYEDEPQQTNRNFSMKPTSNRAPVAPVNRGSQQAATQNKAQRVTLTAEERDIARLAGITPENYIKHKMAQQEFLKAKGRI